MFFFSSRRRHTRCSRDWSSDVCSSDLPDPREAKVLEHVEELGLEGERELGDLVEVDRALVRVLELPGLSPVRTGEGALLVAEELGLEQPRRDRGTVDLDERTLATR